MRGRGLVAVVSAGVVVVTLAGGADATPKAPKRLSVAHDGGVAWYPPAPSPRPGPDPRSPAGLKARAVLVRVMAPSHVSDLVSVKGGFEAATWDSPSCTEVIKVWRYWSRTLTWRRAARIYAPVAFGAYGNSDCIQQVVGGNVNGAPDGVFVVKGDFYGNGMGNAVVIANGRHGWGLVTGDGLTMASTGKSAARWAVSEGIRYQSYFSHDLLERWDANGWFADASSGRYPLEIWFRWKDGGFVALHTNIVVAKVGAAPDVSAAMIGAGNCPSEGTYVASFGLRYNIDIIEATWMVRSFEIFPKASRYPKHVPCTVRVRGSFPITIQVGHARNPWPDPPGPVTRKQWVTAPIWVMLKDFPPGLISADPIRVGAGPYAVPATFGVNYLLTNLGEPDNPNWRVDGYGAPPVPAWGTVTFARGHIVAVALAGTAPPTP